MLLLWRRQLGKTTTIAHLALKRMMQKKGHLFTFASASLMVGREVIYREAAILQSALEELGKQAAKADLKLEVRDRDSSKLPGALDLDGFADVFNRSALEMRLYHDRNTFSRTQVIAPNPATARGYSGDVAIDEIGFIKNFRELWEAMEPIASRQQDFRCLLATTPPDDDAHYSFELAVPPDDAVFPVSPEGHWYESQAGVLVHRCDVFDGYAAGVKLYDTNTREALTPAEHRARALDKDAWDRNYALIFKHGGTAACSLSGLHHAQVTGRGRCVAVQMDRDSDLDPALRALAGVLGKGKVGLGLDVATTEKEKSNPSALAVIEQDGLDFPVRLILRWKTADPERTREIIERVLGVVVARTEGGKARRLCIDATNERFFATALKRLLSGKVFCELVIASEVITHHSEDITMKAYLGNCLVNALDDGHLPIPPERWVKDDWRLVFRDKGSFVNELDAAGNHADTFDAAKLALHGVLGKRNGPAWAMAASVVEGELETAL